jgi:hypothetical protein
MRLRLSNPDLVPELLHFLESRIDVVTKQISDNEHVEFLPPKVFRSQMFEAAALVGEQAEPVGCQNSVRTARICDLQVGG